MRVQYLNNEFTNVILKGTLHLVDCKGYSKYWYVHFHERRKKNLREEFEGDSKFSILYCTDKTVVMQKNPLRFITVYYTVYMKIIIVSKHDCQDVIFI